MVWRFTTIPRRLQVAALDDKAAWRAANPGLGSIKSLDYMESESARAKATPSDQALFRSNDLNAPGAPSRLMIVMLDQWVECADLQQPPREGNCTIGLDLGGSSSMTAASLYWPETGRLESYGAFPGTPDLLARGVLDGVGNRYMIMHERGELAIYPGRVTPVAEFLADLFKRVEAETVMGAAADRYRKAEAEQALDDAGVYWPVEWRGMGSGTAWLLRPSQFPTRGPGAPLVPWKKPTPRIRCCRFARSARMAMEIQVWSVAARAVESMLSPVRFLRLAWANAWAPSPN